MWKKTLSLQVVINGPDRATRPKVVRARWYSSTHSEPLRCCKQNVPGESFHAPGGQVLLHPTVPAFKLQISVTDLSKLSHPEKMGKSGNTAK